MFVGNYVNQSNFNKKLKGVASSFKDANHKYLVIENGKSRGSRGREKRTSFQEITRITNIILNDTTLNLQRKEVLIRNFTIIKDKYKEKYEKLNWFWKLFSYGNSYIDQAESVIANQTAKINLEKPKDPIAVAKLLADKNHTSLPVAKYIVGLINDEDLLASISLFANGYDQTFPSGGAVFVEQAFQGNTGWVEAGWNDQLVVSEEAAPAGQEARFKATSSHVLGHLLNTPRKGKHPSCIRSIPAFSNGHDRLVFDEQPVKMFDPIFNEVKTYVNSEFAFQYQKFVSAYLKACEDKNAIRKEEIKAAAEKVLQDPNFTTDNPNFCQQAGRAFSMKGYLKNSQLEKGSEAEMWEQEKFDAMLRVVEAKLQSRPDLVAKLLLIDDNDTLTFIKSDSLWGTGVDGNGKDGLARCFEEIRSKFRTFNTKDFKGWFASSVGADLAIEEEIVNKEEIVNLEEKDKEKELSKEELNEIFIKEFNAQWSANELARDSNASHLLLYKLFEKEDISDVEVFEILKSKGIRADGSWFLVNEGDKKKPTNLASAFVKVRGKSIESFYSDLCLKKQKADFDIGPILQIQNSRTITPPEDPISCMVTLNSHGLFSNDFFVLPKDVWILAPHFAGYVPSSF